MGSHRPSEDETAEKSDDILFYVLTDGCKRSIYKLDLKRLLSAPAESAAASLQVPPPPKFSLFKRCNRKQKRRNSDSVSSVSVQVDPSPDFSLSECSNRKLKRRNSNSVSSVAATSDFSLSECSNRKLKRSASSATSVQEDPRDWKIQRLKRSLASAVRVAPYLRLLTGPRDASLRLQRLHRPHATMLPDPYLTFLCEGMTEGELPDKMGIVALGRKIYLIGGVVLRQRECVIKETLPRDVYMIDTTQDDPSIVKMTSQLNSGKKCPIAYAIGGKIYVIPHSFNPYFAGKYVECFDPDSNSWSILPDPPLSHNRKLHSKYQILINRRDLWRLVQAELVTSHAVVGSTLVISTKFCGVFALDTSAADKQWKRIVIKYGDDPCPLLNFLPFDPLFSVPLRDNMIFCHVPPIPQADDYHYALEGFLRRGLDLGRGDSYVCSFEGEAAPSDCGAEFIKMSIKPVKGVGGRIGWEEFAEHGPPEWKVRPIGNGLVLVVKCGCDRPIWCTNADIYHSFNIFRVDDEDDQEFVATKVSSVLFRGKNTLTFSGMRSCLSSFIMKDEFFIP